MITFRSKNTYFFPVIIFLITFISCAQKTKTDLNFDSETNTKKDISILTGADRTEIYLPILKDKNIGVVANQTSVLKNSSSKNESKHIVDYLNTVKNINVIKVFGPEHGFRGIADASEIVENGIDKETGIPIISLYGKNKKPSQKQLKGLDIVVFDIQDIGARFYTYISTLHYVMEACAESNIPLIVMDRPNPNGHYVDGPVLEMKHKSFVGMHPVPVVYGMTIGEYARMINGENWLKDGLKCDLTVIELKNYTHHSEYSITIRPSPNIPNDKAVNLYPSLGFFEGTTINAGRGTEYQFQRYGAPFFPKNNFSYTPVSNFGSKYPKHKDKLCYGVDLKSEHKLSQLNLKYLLDAYHKTPKNEIFFDSTFTIHAGTEKLQQQLEQGLTEEEIKKSWQSDLEAFKKIREKYLIYD